MPAIRAFASIFCLKTGAPRPPRPLGPSGPSRRKRTLASSSPSTAVVSPPRRRDAISCCRASTDPVDLLSSSIVWFSRDKSALTGLCVRAGPFISSSFTSCHASASQRLAKALIASSNTTSTGSTDSLSAGAKPKAASDAYSLARKSWPASCSASAVSPNPSKRPSMRSDVIVRMASAAPSSSGPSRAHLPPGSSASPSSPS
mmetsp:Transcript_15878/g.43653  ORF Transcript_15878/g.43653 Transcript_15878/m.43653 type:complete len:202 (-) Transcript_15878:864-1469(-)